MSSLTKSLLALDPHSYELATRSPFLLRAAQGRVPKPLLGAWLANDRLYIHAYIRAIGRALSVLALPETAPFIATAEQRLLKWMIDALVNIHREEEFFVATARGYGIEVNLPTDQGGHVLRDAKSEGLLRIEALFDSLTADHQGQEGEGQEGGGLPWLEFAVVLWGTEKCYLDAWTGAKQEQQDREERGSGGALDLDGGALRKEFIPNWTSREFCDFVGTLGDILDDAVREQIRGGGKSVEEEMLRRAEGKWRELLAAEAAFWPAME